MIINKEALQNKINEMSEKLGVKLVDIFVSYHCQTKDLKFNGFGNMVTKFPVEHYKDNLGKLVEDLQKAITITLNKLYNNEFEVKILFFR
jgi:hypothetical protein